jgi:ADP-ribose pyrophosphatase YjhB (NUDIX family)
MLIELPTADEIDGLAMSTPELSVRKFEFDRKGQAADLDYAPCKGQMMLVIRGEKGTVLVKRKGEKGWSLPSGPISTYEEIPSAAKRVASETCGVHLRSMDLAALYDVVWHYKGVTVKRLHVVYAAVTDDDCSTAESKYASEAKFHKDVPASTLRDDLDRTALDDCSQKQL